MRHKRFFLPLRARVYPPKDITFSVLILSCERMTHIELNDT